MYHTKAMEECPPDIFDLEVVMAGKDSAQKIRQYLWQINGARRDATLVRHPDKPRSPTPPSNRFLANRIRIAMIVNYYLKSMKTESLASVLEGWIPDTGDYKSSLTDLKDGFIREYEHVIANFGCLPTENDLICDSLASRIQSLIELPEYKKIAENLSSLYHEYYTLLDAKQRTPNYNRDDMYNKRMFELCCTMIDKYQAQSPLDISI